MCPVCLTTAALSAAGVSSGAGALALAAGKWRAMGNWLRNFARPPRLNWRRQG
jgi:hypothetical protein